jgi:hypothetical protein
MTEYLAQRLPVSVFGDSPNPKTLKPPSEGYNLYHSQVHGEYLYLIWHLLEWPVSLTAEAQVGEEVPYGG